MKQENNILPIFIHSILNFATKNLQDIEKDNVISQIDYYARVYAKQKNIDYENLPILESDFSESNNKKNALELAHNLTNPILQSKDDVRLNLIACKSFLKII